MAKLSGELIALDLSRRCFHAIVAREESRRLNVRSVFSVEVPVELRDAEPEEYGRWIGDQLRNVGLGRVRVVVGISREHVGLKRLVLPTIDAAELPDMTRLAMQRDLPFDADDAIIDFIKVAQSETSTTVLAVAIPGSLRDEIRTIVDAAKLTLDRITLRGMGVAALTNALGHEPSVAMLAIDLTGSSVVFQVIAQGVIRFSRAAELPDVNNDIVLADHIITETQRTWMSFRVTEDVRDVKQAILLGDEKLCALSVEAISETLGISAEVLHDHPMVQFDANTPGAAWALAGLLLEPLLGLETINFLHPRKAPDRAARKRQLILATVGAVLIGLFATWTLGNRSLSNLDTQHNALRAQRDQMQPRYMNYFRQSYQVMHIKKWEAIGVDWLDHLSEISSEIQPSNQIVLDGWRGTLAFSGVEYARKNNRGGTDPWKTPVRIKIVIEGEAADRPTADALREALVGNESYRTSAGGTESAGGKRLPYGFTYTLQTVNLQPVDGKAP